MSLSKKNLDKLNKFKKKKNLNNESKNINNYTNIPKNDNLIINPLNSCLLYTSPSPRDRQKSRMPSSA